jgi:1,4-dihydroxy-6-naphthoate synthase
MTLTLGFSPCPNDTFIFDALVNQKIDTGGLRFDYILEDVETLNRMALREKLDITKISYGALPGLLPMYQVLNAGGALGMGVGPLLVSSRSIQQSEVENMTIALPGEHTTAHMLFSMAFPGAKKKTFRVFSGIEQAVLTGEVDLGVIIHENRFTYAEKGLICLMDLGDHWEKQTGNPIPLGGIVMNRRFDKQLMKRVDDLIRQSVLSARQQYPSVSDFIRCHAQEMDENVMRQHIDLYVNDFSVDLGSRGRAAVWQMLEIASTFRTEPETGSYEVFC